MRKLRLAIMCVACAGLLALPAAAGAQQKQKPGADQRISFKCRIATAQQTQAQKRIDGAKRAIRANKKTIAKQKKAVKRAKSKKGKRKARRKLKAARRKLKQSREGLATSTTDLKRANQRVAGACT